MLLGFMIFFGMAMSTQAPKNGYQTSWPINFFGFAKHWLGYFWLKNRDTVSSGYSQGLFYENKRMNNDVNQSSILNHQSVHIGNKPKISSR
jgi:hypothetical protein